MHNTIKLNAAEVYVNTTTLFTRLAAIAKRDCREKCFYYELTTKPMSLFKNGVMRKLDKPVLRKALLKNEILMSIDDIKNTCIFVIDGGVLLHQLLLIKGKTFLEMG